MANPVEGVALKGRELLKTIVTGGDVSRKRIYHAAADLSLDGRIPFKQYVRAGNALDVDPMAIRALAIVESQEKALIGSVPPSRLEIRPWKKYRKATASGKAFDNANNSRDLLKRWAQFQKMRALQSIAAIKSHSFGAFQIMGFNAELCGYTSYDEFVDAMMTVEGQVTALIRFIKNSPILHQALKDKNAHLVAHHYNGPAYKRNRYHTKWAAALEAPLA